MKWMYKVTVSKTVEEGDSLFEDTIDGNQLGFSKWTAASSFKRRLRKEGKGGGWKTKSVVPLMKWDIGGIGQNMWRSAFSLTVYIFAIWAIVGTIFNFHAQFASLILTKVPLLNRFAEFFGNGWQYAATSATFFVLAVVSFGRVPFLIALSTGSSICASAVALAGVDFSVLLHKLPSAIETMSWPQELNGFSAALAAFILSWMHEFDAANWDEYCARKAMLSLFIAFAILHWIVL